jgi:hypothetical protein
MSERTVLAVNRSSITTTELRTEPLGALVDEQVRVRVDHVAITANTITYAQFGDLLAYWSFYPLDDHWGLVPAVGWGTVVQSQPATRARTSARNDSSPSPITATSTHGSRTTSSGFSVAW